jgi:formyltetrahydrofolate deformylase
VPADEFILNLSCPDKRGIVNAVASVLASRGANIISSQQFGDTSAGTFFMRVHFAAEEGGDLADWRAAFQALGEEWGMRWDLFDGGVRPRVLVLVSRLGHCLNDLLYRWQTGDLSAEIVAVASPYDDLAAMATTYGVRYLSLPGTDASQDARDRAILDLAHDEQADLVVLARYMQVLGSDACAQLEGRAINIHHSFLPSFKGARSYHQAYERGVKLIGATAHYVTTELDEGPIIEQEVARVDHAHGPDELARVGRDVECQALSRAVRWHAERRVLIHAGRTIVFR